VAAQRTQESFEAERNAEIDASIAAVAAQRSQESFEAERNAEIDASIAAVAAQRSQESFGEPLSKETDASVRTTLPAWLIPTADMQVGSIPQAGGPEGSWQP
jgi:hypothetical protein